MPLLLTAACATGAVPEGDPTFASVHDRLADGPTRMFIGPEGSSGSVTASRLTRDGWVDGVSPVTINNGELMARLTESGQLAIDNFEVAVDPIALPDAVFGKPAQLQGVRVVLHAPPAPTALTWTDDDDATGTVTLDLDLQWAIAIDGTVTPLGTQPLPPIKVDVGLAGAGDHVDASVGLNAAGVLRWGSRTAPPNPMRDRHNGVAL